MRELPGHVPTPGKRGEKRMKVASRCDPHDSDPVAAYVGAVPELSIDERIRMVVRSMTALDNSSSGEPTEEDLVLLEEMSEVEMEPMTPYQAILMEPERGGTLDADGFIAEMSEEERVALKTALQAVDEAMAAGKASPGEGEAAGDAE